MLFFLKQTVRTTICLCVYTSSYIPRNTRTINCSRKLIRGFYYEFVSVGYSHDSDRAMLCMLFDFKFLPTIDLEFIMKLDFISRFALNLRQTFANEMWKLQYIYIYIYYFIISKTLTRNERINKYLLSISLSSFFN